MAISQKTGGSITKDATEHTDIFVLLDERTNRYHDGYAVGYLQGLTGLQPPTPIPTKQELKLDNLMNAEPLIVNPVTKSACVIIKLPRTIRRQFKTKFIPPGTMFDCTFLGGDLSKLKISGIHEDPTGSVKLDDKMNEHDL